MSTLLRRRMMMAMGMEEDEVKEWIDCGVQSVDIDDAVSYLVWDVPDEVTELYFVGNLVMNADSAKSININSDNNNGDSICQPISIPTSNMNKTLYVCVYLKNFTPDDAWFGFGGINSFNFQSCNQFIGRQYSMKANSGKIYFGVLWRDANIANGTNIRLYAR